LLSGAGVPTDQPDEPENRCSRFGFVMESALAKLWSAKTKASHSALYQGISSRAKKAEPCPIGRAVCQLSKRPPLMMPISPMAALPKSGP
jgi:hypothetical protein